MSIFTRKPNLRITSYPRPNRYHCGFKRLGSYDCPFPLLKIFPSAQLQLREATNTLCGPSPEELQRHSKRQQVSEKRPQRPDQAVYCTSKTNGGSGFGTWGSNWNTGTTWDFSTTTAATTTETEAKYRETNSKPWSLNRGIPREKNHWILFGALYEEKTKPGPNLPAEKKEEDKFNFGFTSVSKKDKKMNKGSLADPGRTKEPTPAAEEATTKDEWGAWRTNKSKKKGGKNFEYEPDPAKAEPKEEEPAVVEDEWLWGTSRKTKRRKAMPKPRERRWKRRFNRSISYSIFI